MYVDTATDPEPKPSHTLTHGRFCSATALAHAVLSASTELSSDVFLTYDDDFAKVRKIRCIKPEDYLKKLKMEGTTN